MESWNDMLTGCTFQISCWRVRTSFKMQKDVAACVHSMPAFYDTWEKDSEVGCKTYAL